VRWCDRLVVSAGGRRPIRRHAAALRRLRPRARRPQEPLPENRRLRRPARLRDHESGLQRRAPHRRYPLGEPARQAVPGFRPDLAKAQRQLAELGARLERTAGGRAAGTVGPHGQRHLGAWASAFSSKAAAQTDASGGRTPTSPSSMTSARHDRNRPGLRRSEPSGGPGTSIRLRLSGVKPNSRHHRCS